MNKDILNGAIYSYLSFFASAIIGIVYTPFLLSSLGQSEFGLYNLALTVCTYLMLLDNGFNSSVVRYISYYKGQNDNEKMQSVASTAFVLYTILGVLCLFLGIMLFTSLPNLYGNSLSTDELRTLEVIVLLIVVYMSVNFPMSVLQSILMSHEKFSIIKITKLVASFLMPLCMTPLLLAGYKAVVMTLVSVILGISSSLCYYVFVKKLGTIRITYKYFDKSVLKKLVVFSIPIFIIMLFDCLHRSFGTFYIGIEAGTIGVTIFALTIQMRNYVESFVKALTSLFLPKFSMQVSQGADNRVFSDQFRTISRLELHIALFITIGLAVFGYDFYHYWAKDVDTLVLYKSTLLLIIPIVLPMSMSIGEEIVKAMDLQKTQMYVYVLRFVIAFAIMIIWTKKYGSYACALALGLSSFLCDCALMSVFYKYKVRMDMKAFFKSITGNYISVIAFTIIVYFTHFYMGPFYLKCLLFIGFCGFYYLLFFNKFEKDIINKVKLRIIK